MLLDDFDKAKIVIALNALLTGESNVVHLHTLQMTT